MKTAKVSVWKLSKWSFIACLGIVFYGSSVETCKAQSLGFSRVLMVGNVEDTVPAGKTWKIESYLFSSSLPNAISSGSGSGTYANSNDRIIVNGVNTDVRSFRSAGGYYHASTAIWEQPLPVWLPAGTRLQSGTGVSGISIMEFNILP